MLCLKLGKRNNGYILKSLLSCYVLTSIFHNCLPGIGLLEVWNLAQEAMDIE